MGKKEDTHIIGLIPSRKSQDMHMLAFKHKVRFGDFFSDQTTETKKQMWSKTTFQGLISKRSFFYFSLSQ